MAHKATLTSVGKEKEDAEITGEGWTSEEDAKPWAELDIFLRTSPEGVQLWGEPVVLQAPR